MPSSIRRDIQNGFLTLTCQTISAPPTNLKWYKDGLPINYDRDVYMVSQKIINRYSTYYDNSLVFISDDAEDMIGEFRCRTTTGRSSSTISIQGIYFNILIINAHQCDHHYIQDCRLLQVMILHVLLSVVNLVGQYNFPVILMSLVWNGTRVTIRLPHHMEVICI